MEQLDTDSPLALARGALLAGLTGVPVVTLVPASRPDKFVLVQQLGGTRRNVVTDSVLIAVQGWAKSQYEAERLNRECLGILEASGREVGVRKFVPYSLPQWFPDPDTNTPRFQFSGELRIIARKR